MTDLVLLITGSRNWKEPDTIREVLRRIRPLYLEPMLIHGGARGVDEIAGVEARRLGFDVKVMRADWRENGRAAGPIRNTQMVTFARVMGEKQGCDVVCLAFWDGESRGTKDCFTKAHEAGIDTEIITEKEVTES